ncbi:MAG: hypothetical protein K0R05_1887 [Anaerocolumna sp.]|jgi:hypothetical protein|nr:hypothetical protein [Anaerocolumna sp.]
MQVDTLQSDINQIGTIQKDIMQIDTMQIYINQIDTMQIILCRTILIHYKEQKLPDTYCPTGDISNWKLLFCSNYKLYNELIASLSWFNALKRVDFGQARLKR